MRSRFPRVYYLISTSNYGLDQSVLKARVSETPQGGKHLRLWASTMPRPGHSASAQVEKPLLTDHKRRCPSRWSPACQQSPHRRTLQLPFEGHSLLWSRFRPQSDQDRKQRALQVLYLANMDLMKERKFSPGCASSSLEVALRILLLIRQYKRLVSSISRRERASWRADGSRYGLSDISVTSIRRCSAWLWPCRSTTVRHPLRSVGQWSRRSA